jgi:MFS family permease
MSATSPDAPPRLFALVFPSIMLPVFITISDQTLVASALPDIAADLGQVTLISWVVVIYLMCNTLTAPVYGRLGDLLGRRRMMLVALGVTMLGTALALSAQSLGGLLWGRAIQGLGGGGLMSLAQALIGQHVPPRERGRFQGYLSTITVTATVVGPLLGSLLTHHFGWRAALSISLPLSLIAMGLVLRLPAGGGRGTLRGFDFPGLVWFAAMVAPFLFAIQQVRPVMAGGSPVALVAGLAVSAAGLVLLVRRERRTDSPLFLLPLLARPPIWRAALIAGCHGASFVSFVAFTPIYLVTARGLEQSGVGLMLLCLTLGTGLSGLVTGNLISRTGRTAIFPSLGLSLLVVLLLGFAAFSQHFGQPLLMAWYFAMSVCYGTVMGVMQITAQNAAGQENLGAVASAVQFSRMLGASIGTAVVGVVLFAVLQGGGGDAAGVFVQVLEGDGAGLAAQPAATQAAMRAEIAVAFRAAFLSNAAFTFTGMLAAWSLPVRRIS